jgi:hypothetical protein
VSASTAPTAWSHLGFPRHRRRSNVEASYERTACLEGREMASCTGRPVPDVGPFVAVSRAARARARSRSGAGRARAGAEGRAVVQEPLNSAGSCGSPGGFLDRVREFDSCRGHFGDRRGFERNCPQVGRLTISPFRSVPDRSPFEGQDHGPRPGCFEGYGSSPPRAVRG